MVEQQMVAEIWMIIARTPAQSPCCSFIVNNKRIT